MGIRIRIGSKQDACRSVYGILYNDSGPNSSDATSFWCGILDGPANIRAHTKSEVFDSYQSRVLEPRAEYREVQHFRLEPKGIFTHGYYDLARVITRHLQDPKCRTSGPDEPLEKIIVYAQHWGKALSLPRGIGFWEADRSGFPQPESSEDLQTQIQKIPASLPWIF